MQTAVKITIYPGKGDIVIFILHQKRMKHHILVTSSSCESHTKGAVGGMWSSSGEVHMGVNADVFGILFAGIPSENIIPKCCDMCNMIGVSFILKELSSKLIHKEVTNTC